MKQAYFLIIFSVFISCQSQTKTRHEESLNRAIDQFNEAFKTVDLATLNQMTTEQYSHTNGSSAPVNKSNWFNYLKKRKKQIDSGELQILQYDFKEIQYRIYENSAFVTGVIEIAGSMDTIEFKRRIRVSHFWINENDQWKRAGFHDSRIE